MDLPLEVADDLEVFASLLARLHSRLGSAMSLEQAAALLESARGTAPGEADPSGVDLDPAWEALDSAGPAAVFEALLTWVQTLLDSLPAEHSERLVEEFAPDLDRAVEAAERWRGV